MTTPTTNFSWGKPIVGGDSNTWGTELNTIFDSIDALCAAYFNAAATTLKCENAFTAAHANIGGGNGPAVINAGLVSSLANNGTHSIITLVQGQISTVFACIYVNGGILDYITANCIYDGIQDTQVLSKTLTGSGIDVVGSGADVQVKNTTGSSANIAWKVT